MQATDHIKQAQILVQQAYELIMNAAEAMPNDELEDRITKRMIEKYQKDTAKLDGHLNCCLLRLQK